MVKNSNDPDVARYVIANLRDNPAALSCVRFMIKNLCKDAQRQLVQLSFNDPGYLQRHVDNPQLGTILTKKFEHEPIKPMTFMMAQQDFLKKRDELFKKQGENMMKLQQELMKQQLQFLIKQQQKQQQEMATIWGDLLKLDNEILIRKMNDPNPMVALLAVQVAGKKRLPVEKECIELLSSAYPPMRQAARQTLIRLGRGVDFGPEPSATSQQIAASTRSWTSWSNLQTVDQEEE